MPSYSEGQKSASVPKPTRKTKDKVSEKTEKEKSNKERGSFVSLASRPETQVRRKPETGFVECVIIVLSVKIYLGLQISLSLAFLYALLCHLFSFTSERD